MKKIVLFSFHNSDFFSGATRSLLDILDQVLVDGEIEPIAVFPTKNGSAVEYLHSKNVRTFICYWHPLVQDEKQNILIRLLKLPFFFLWLLQTIINIKILHKQLKDVEITSVYSNTSINITGAFLQKFYSIPNIWHFREFRHEDHHIHYFCGDNLFMRFANKYSEKMIFISKEMLNYHVSLGGNRNKMILAYNDVSPRYIINKDINSFLNAPDINLLVAGDIKPGKAQLDVIKSVKLLVPDFPNLHLYLAGNFKKSQYCDDVQRYIESNKLSANVHILGLVKDMNQLRTKCHIGIVSSVKEAFGRVTVEAMLAGLVVVGRNTGGTVELVDNNKTGFLYDAKDPNNLANIIRMLISDRKKACSIAQNGQKYAIETFTRGNCYSSIKSLLIN